MLFMMIFRFFLFLIFISCSHAQNTIEETLERYNDGTVPYISTGELAGSDNYAVLDTRARKEYQVSHLKNAIWVGYSGFELDRVSRAYPDKSTPLVVYCSVGVRSEDIGEKLLAAGYTNVRNLYGGIFQWKIDGYPVFDRFGQPTSKVHAYSKHWGALLNNAEKVY